MTWQHYQAIQPQSLLTIKPNRQRFTAGFWRQCAKQICAKLSAVLLLCFSMHATAAPLANTQALPQPNTQANTPKNTLRASNTNSKGKVLFVVSNQRFHGQSKLPASISFGEVIHAWDTITAAGYSVDFVSPTGGAVPIDPAMLGPKLTKRLDDKPLMALLANTLQPQQLDATHYQAVYYVGGSNAMYQVPDHPMLQQITRQIYEQQGIVSAVCHGTAGLAHIKLSNGQYLVAGKRVTGYPEEYEDQQEAYFAQLPFRMRHTFESRGAVFNAPDPEQPHIEVDGNLVTGQNYPSAPLVAAAVVQLLEQNNHKRSALQSSQTTQPTTSN